MFRNLYEVKMANVCTQPLQISAFIILLVLLHGCAAVGSAKPQSIPAAPNIACTNDTDTFCTEREKDSALRLNQQGLEYATQHDYDKAVDLFLKAIELDNSNPEFHYNLGVTYSHKMMREEEELAYLRGLAVNSSDPQHVHFVASIHFNLACMYALQGKKDKAFEHLEKMYATADTLLYHYVESDADLASLRDDPRYKELITRHKGN